MTFARCLALVETRNKREKRQQELSEGGSESGRSDEWRSAMADLREYGADNADNVPSVGDIAGIFNKMAQ